MGPLGNVRVNRLRDASRWERIANLDTSLSLRTSNHLDTDGPPSRGGSATVPDPEHKPERELTPRFRHAQGAVTTMPRTTTEVAPPVAPTTDRLFVSVKEAAAMLGLSRNQTYDLLDRGAIEARYMGRRRLVSLASVHTFAESLPTERSA